MNQASEPYLTAVANLSAALISLLVFSYFRSRVLGFLEQKDMFRSNYKDRPVLTAGGLLLLFPCLSAIVPLMIAGLRYELVAYSLVILSLCFSGLIDDVLGDSSAKGLSGHIRKLTMGGFSTGALKAIAGAAAGIVVSLTRSDTFLEFAFDVIIFAFSVNLINLLDLRPGRSVKAYVFIVLLMAIISGFSSLWIIIPSAAALFLYIKGELNEAYMLGDTGANLIGGVLGMYGTYALPLSIKIVYAVFLILVHIFAEHYSISKWIENVTVLRKIDMLGRRDWR